MKIRKAIFKDIKRINEILLEGSIQEHTFQNPGNKKKIKENVTEDFNHHKKAIKKKIQDKKQCWIVLEEKGVVVGFGSTHIKGNQGFIESVYITKEAQRKGYGKKILKYLVNWLKSKKVKHIESYLLVKNIPSLKLHEKLGFKPYLFKMRLK